VAQQELEMAQQLIDSWTTEWKPDKYKDTYRDALLKVIRAKRKGQEVHVAPEVEEEEAPDLLTALRASVERSKSGRRRKAQPSYSRNGRRADDDLSALSKTRS
jgi:DNA end-binding protein Ku